MRDTRTKFEIYYAASKRLLMWHLLAKPLELVLVTEYPKSGASWVCQMVSEATALPFFRNRTPKLRQCVMHGHHLYHPRMGKSIGVLRDGRDIMVSAYFYFLFVTDKNRPEGVAKHRDKLQFKNYNEVEKNMPEFIEYMFTDYAKRNIFHFNWTDYVQNITSYADSICIIKYEDLLERPISCLDNILRYYEYEYSDTDYLNEIVEKYSFKNLTGRERGKEDRKSFVRKGIAGDWKNYFNNTACEVFKEYAGEALISAGYEKDQSWTANI